MTRVLAFRHSPHVDLGTVRPALESRGIQIEVAESYDAGTPRDVSGAAGLVFLGGEMSVNDGLPWLESEMELIREAAVRGQPVFGICLGAQLIARALGARVRRNPRKEIGWYTIELTPEAADDAVFGGLAPVQTVFQWHGETFDLPEGATLLACSELCRNQAFSLGEAIYGVQFHPEVTPAMIRDWCARDAAGGDAREVAEPPDPEFHREQLAGFSDTLLGRWSRKL